MKMISKIGAAVLLTALSSSSVYAIPSFARQTGLSCDACHAGGMFPALTQTGRQFKLNGYTMGGGHTKMPLPLAAMIQVGFSTTQKGSDGSTSANGAPGNRNNHLTFPQMSIFYGGKIYGHVGALIQVTYDSSDLPDGLTTQRIGADNSDIRYANHTHLLGDNLIYGVSLNNSPTVQDVYASTPTWGFPWADPGNQASLASPMIAGLGQQVVGLSAYALYNDFLYVEFGGYQDTQYRNGILKNMGFNDAGGITGYVSGTAPYARVAFQKYYGNNFFMIGGYGMDTNIAQQGTTHLDKYTDIAIDGEYQYIAGKNAVTVAARNTWENQTLNGSYALGNVASKTGSLSVFSSMATYVYNSKYGASLGYGYVNSTGVAAGQDSSNYIAQLNYFPLQNIRIVAQYMGYLKTNSQTNAANSTDYNTFSLGAWFMF